MVFFLQTNQNQTLNKNKVCWFRNTYENGPNTGRHRHTENQVLKGNTRGTRNTWSVSPRINKIFPGLNGTFLNSNCICEKNKKHAAVIKRTRNMMHHVFFFIFTKCIRVLLNIEKNGHIRTKSH